jgi:hypothetical protein
VRPLTEGISFEDNLAHHVGIIAEIVQDVSEHNETVSPSFQLGIHPLGANAGVSNVIRRGLPDGLHFTWR